MWSGQANQKDNKIENLKTSQNITSFLELMEEFKEDQDYMGKHLKP